MHADNRNKKADVIRISGVDPLKCMRCGKCTATCPSYDEMEYHPHQFVYMVEKGEIDKLAQSDSLFKCLTCFACVERCPRGVEPAKLIEAVRDIVIREQGNNHMTMERLAQRIAELDDELPQQAIVTALRKYNK